MSKRERIYMYAGTVIAFGLCSLFHFAYDFLGRLFWLAGFFPISESIWEHLKLPFFQFDASKCDTLVWIGEKMYVDRKIIICGFSE